MLKLGRFNELTVTNIADFGVFLDGGKHGNVLLPKKACPQDVVEGQTLEVFVYLDSKDRPTATFDTPKVQVGEFAVLTCIEVNRIGAFLDWGLDKDLLVPFSEQRTKMETGKDYLCYVYLDEESNRITATSKVDDLLEEPLPYLAIKQEVDLIIADQTDLGYKAVVNQGCFGLLHHKEVSAPLHFGQKIKGYVHFIRPDGKINLSLTKSGYEKLDAVAEKILALLDQNQGFVALTDKSSPEQIKRVLGVSKRAYKLAVGGLLRHKRITLTETGIKKH